MTQVSKRCFKCGEVKPLSEFYKHGRMADGHLNKCKECTKCDVKKNREENADYYRDYDRALPCHSDRVEAKATRNREAYHSSTEYKRRIEEHKSKWNAANKNKRLAHRKVYNYVRDGKLSKPTKCSCCGGENVKIHGHHWSYLESNWLDVIWLCSKCHGLEHKRINHFGRLGVDVYSSVNNSEDVLQNLLEYVVTLPKQLVSHIPF